jgi:site-specific DNA recombinase
MTGHSAKSKSHFYYLCSRSFKQGKDACDARMLPKAKLERLVIEQLKSKVLTDENLEELVKLTNRALDSDMASQKAELDAILQAIDDTGRRLDRLYDAVETGKMGLDDLAPRIREQRQRQEQLQAKRIEIEAGMSERRVELIDLKTMTDYITDIQAVLQEGTLVERKAFIRSFIKDVRVCGDEAVLTYSLPELPEKVSLNETGVPRIEYRGGPLCTIRRTFNLAFSLAPPYQPQSYHEQRRALKTFITAMIAGVTFRCFVENKLLTPWFLPHHSETE